MSKPKPWAWRENAMRDSEGRPSWDLVSPDGHSHATVWSNGVWHTWNWNGVGGENASEPSVREAAEQAVIALHRQALANPGEFRDPMPILPAMPLGEPKAPEPCYSCGDRSALHLREAQQLLWHLVRHARTTGGADLAEEAERYLSRTVVTKDILDGDPP